MWLLWNPAALDSASGSADLSAMPVQVQFAAPDLTLNDLSGQAGSLADFVGQVVLVNLWATWCPPCKEEMPVFQDFYTEHRGEGFTVLAINDGEHSAAVRSFVEDWQITFPVWLDPSYEASDHAFRTASLPTSYIVDRAGLVRLMWIGAINRPNLDQYVIPILQE